jgi:hypothetical protein
MPPKTIVGKLIPKPLKVASTPKLPLKSATVGKKVTKMRATKVSDQSATDSKSVLGKRGRVVGSDTIGWRIDEPLRNHFIALAKERYNFYLVEATFHGNKEDEKAKLLFQARMAAKEMARSKNTRLPAHIRTIVFDLKGNNDGAINLPIRKTFTATVGISLWTLLTHFDKIFRKHPESIHLHRRCPSRWQGEDHVFYEGLGYKKLTNPSSTILEIYPSLGS